MLKTNPRPEQRVIMTTARCAMEAATATRTAAALAGRERIGVMKTKKFEALLLSGRGRPANFPGRVAFVAQLTVDMSAHFVGTRS